MTVTATATSTATYAEVFSVPAFRVIFFSRALAIAADSLRIMALSVLVYSLTRSPMLSAITFGIGFIPQVFGGFMLGSLADRLRPRALITAGYLVECAAAATLALVPMPVGVSLAIVGAVAAFVPVFGGASSRLVAEVLTGDAYVLGRSLSSISVGAAQVFGLTLGGLAVAAVGAQRALLVTATCHAIAMLIIRFGLSDLDPPPAAGNASVVKQSWLVNAGLLGTPASRQLLLIQWLPPAFIVGGEALLVAYAETRHFPAGSAGMLLGCVAAGMMLGHLVLGRFVAPDMRTRLVRPLIVLLGLPSVALAVDPPAWAVATLLFITGACFSYPLGIQKAFLEAIPQTQRGQAFALLSTGLMTMQGIGPLVFGSIAQGAGVRFAIVAAGLACASTAIIRWRPPT